MIALVVGIGVSLVFVFGGSSRDTEATQPSSAAAPSTVSGDVTPTALVATTTTLSTTTSTISGVLTAAEIGERFGDAVWKVEVEGCGYEGSGSSFAISPHHLVTNRHVVEFDSGPTLVSRSGVVLRGLVLGSSPVPDVAVIEVNQRLDTYLEWAPSETVSLGDPIVTLGYPAPDGDFTVTPGSVLSFGTDEGYGRFIRTDGQIDFGNSGGPALDESGQVVGVVTSLEANPTGAQLVPQIFSSDVIRPVVDAITGAPSYPERICDVAVAESPVDEYVDFWTVIVASLPVDEYGFDGAYDWATDFYIETGLWADVLLSDLYASLNPGYWAVYTGYFLSPAESADHCDYVKSLGYDCYTKQVSWYFDE